MDNAVTDLPEPDSPTRATVCPFFYPKGDVVQHLAVTILGMKRQ